MDDLNQKLLIDVEEQNEAIAYYVKSEVEVVLAGKNIIPVPENERTFKIYKLLEENCDVIFCTTQKLDDFQFYPVPTLCIFAIDNDGNCFGTIGGIGDMANDDHPVGYVNRNGMYGKISGSLKEFLELITFHPYWRDILRLEQMKTFYDIKVIEKKKKENDLQYFAHQCEISEILKLSKNPKSIELLISHIKSTSKFVVYGSKKEAQMRNKFWNKPID